MIFTDKTDIEKAPRLLFTGRRQEAFCFWFIGLGIVIPTVTYISSTLVAFLLIVAFDQIGIFAGGNLKPLGLTINGVCAGVSLFGYYRLWVLYRQKKGKKSNPT